MTSARNPQARGSVIRANVMPNSEKMIARYQNTRIIRWIGAKSRKNKRNKSKSFPQIKADNIYTLPWSETFGKEISSFIGISGTIISFQRKTIEALR